eukprot:gene11466-biopygen7226
MIPTAYLPSGLYDGWSDDGSDVPEPTDGGTDPGAAALVVGST